MAADDLYLLAVLNSPLLWWYNWRYLPHMKDEALSPVAFLMESLPIARHSESARKIESTAADCSRLPTNNGYAATSWIGSSRARDREANHEAAIADEPGFRWLRRGGQQTAGQEESADGCGLRSLRDEYARTIEPARQLVGDALTLERQLSDLVNEAYGLTPDEVNLLWDTAPPRMPIPDPRDRKI